MSLTDEKYITIDSISYTERVVPGWDVEVGYRLPNNPELAFFVRVLIGTTKIDMIILD